MNKKKLGFAFIPALLFSACTMESPPTAEPAVEATPAPPSVPQQIFRSAKTLSTNCGPYDRTTPPPGFAERTGAEQRDMPPPMAEGMAVGADREPVEADLTRTNSGYTMIEPLMVAESTLIDLEGEVIATIVSDYEIEFTRLLPNGNRLTSTPVVTDVFTDGGGRRGCLEEYSADGKLLWRLGLESEQYIQHHDAVKLPNGNLLAVVWEDVSTDHVIALGRDPELTAENGHFWYDGVIEVNPYTAEIVWEWSFRHHLIQEFDSSKRNYGVVAEHPELLDINAHQKQQDGSIDDDWTHFNAMDYNPDLDLIILSSNYLSEVYVIDHSTSPWEAAGHSGGNYGKGGDILYRWGNPERYGRGGPEDQTLFNQHNIQWIRDGLPGAGNLLVFNNGNMDARPYSTVVEFAPGMNADGTFAINDTDPFSANVIWEYDPEPPERFFSFFISGAQRLPNGNTLVNRGAGGEVREVTTDGEIVWEYTYRNDIEAPHMLFRANRYPEDHPGIQGILSQQ